MTLVENSPKMTGSGADPGISKRGGGRGPGAVELFDLRFALMPLYTYPMFLLEE